MQGKTNKILDEGLWANINKKKKSGRPSSPKGSKAYKAAKKAGEKLERSKKSKMDEIASQYIDKNALFEGLAGAVGGAVGGMAGAAGGPIGSAVGSAVGEKIGNTLAGDEETKAKKTLCGRCGHRHVKGTKCPRPFKKKKS